MFKFVLFAVFATAVFALPVEEKKDTAVETVSRALNELEEQGVIEDIRNLMGQVGQFFGDDSTANTNVEERSRKKKKMEAIFLVMMVFGATLIPLILGALALIAGKALVVSKLALVLALILGIKKLLSQKKEVIVEQAPATHGWGRSIEAQNLAYSAYAPQ